MFLTPLQGWSVSDFETLTNKRALSTVTLLFVFQYFAVFVWGVVGRDRADAQSVYTSIPGALVIALRVCVMLWFGFSVLRTHAAEVGLVFWFSFRWVLRFLTFDLCARRLIRSSNAFSFALASRSRFGFWVSHLWQLCQRKRRLGTERLRSRSF